MFGLRYFRQMVIQTPAEDSVADESKQHLSSCKIVAANTALVSANSAEAEKPEKTKKTRWRNRLFGHIKTPQKKESNPGEDTGKKESTCDATETAKPTAPEQPTKKTRWWHQLLKCFRKKNRVAPSPEDKPEELTGEEPSTVAQQDDVVPFEMPQEEPCPLDAGQPGIVTDTPLWPELLNHKTIPAENFIKALLMTEFNNSFSDGATLSTIDRFGFPNIRQSCYLNSSLQSLLNLEDFVRDISRQEQIWSSVPDIQLIRKFMAIRDAHISTDCQSKIRLLHAFKETVSILAPEFRDHHQKDAHEFLMSVLNQMRNLSPLLQDIAVWMGRSYTCPVEDHLVFKLENTRTCKRCGAQSKTVEEFTNLSLDLVPEGSVEQMLEEYMKETELDYKCQCGGNTSGQRSAFETLPRVLILHLKRFRYTSSYKLVKVHNNVELMRDLVVSSKQGGGCYSLVNAISHFGSTGEGGHYICDGVHPDNSPEEPTDRWLTFNDSMVMETTGASVCEQRKNSAYILFYQRHV